jgi:hypothetical protein
LCGRGRHRGLHRALCKYKEKKRGKKGLLACDYSGLKKGEKKDIKDRETIALVFAETYDDRWKQKMGGENEW